MVGSPHLEIDSERNKHHLWYLKACHHPDHTYTNPIRSCVILHTVPLFCPYTVPSHLEVNKVNTVKQGIRPKVQEMINGPWLRKWRQEM